MAARHAGLRGAAVWVVLAAYVFGALIPAGWMPAAMAGETGHYIVICTMSGLKTVAVDSNGNPSEEEPSHGSDHEAKSCAYGTAPKQALDAGDSVFVSSDEALHQRMRVFVEAPHAGYPRYTIYASRAPPISI